MQHLHSDNYAARFWNHILAGFAARVKTFNGARPGAKVIGGLLIITGSPRSSSPAQSLHIVLIFRFAEVSAEIQ